MTARAVPTYEEVLQQVHELKRQVSTLRELVLNVRYELGEPFERRAGPIHTRVEAIETTFHKRQT